MSTQRSHAFRTSLLSLFRWVLLAIFALAILLCSALLLLEKRWGAQIVESSIRMLNSRLNVPIATDGVRFTFFKNFPHASLHLRNVIVRGSHPEVFGEGDTLLIAGNVYLVLNPWRLLQGQYELQSSIIDHGFLNLRESKRGLTNYDIHFLRDTLADSPGATPDLLFKHLELRNMELHYHGAKSAVEASLSFSELKARLAFARGNLQVKLAGQGLIDELAQGQFTYAKRQHFALRSTLQTQADSVWVEGAKVSVDTNEFAVEGGYSKATRAVSLTLESDEINLRTLLNFASQYQLKLPLQTQLKGGIRASLQLDGSLLPGHNLAIGLKVEGQSIGVRLRDETYQLESLSAYFSNGEKASPITSTITLSQCLLRHRDSRVQLRGTLANLEHPTVFLHVEGQLKDNQVKFPGDCLQGYASIGLTGEFLATFPSLSEVKLSAVQQPRLSAELTLEDLTLKVKGVTLRGVQGSITLREQDLVKGALLGTLQGNTSFSLGLNVKNILANLTHQGKARWTMAANLHDAPLDSLMAPFLVNHPEVAPREEGANGQDSLQKKPFSVWDDNELFQVECYLHDAKYRNFQLDSARFSLQAEAASVVGNLRTASLLEGRLRGNITLERGVVPPRLRASFTPENIELKRLFYAANNFNQKVITSRNLSGRLSGTITFQIPWRDSAWQYRDLNLSAQLLVRNGTLDSVEALKRLGNFISLDKLASIQFDEMRNTFTVTDRTLTVPRMEINSSALSLFIEGTHHFDSRYQYRVNLSLSDLLFNRLRVQKREVAENSLPVDQLDTMDFRGVRSTRRGGMIFLILEGDSVSSHVSYDYEALRSTLSGHIAREKQTLHDLYNEELSPDPTQTPRDSMAVEKKEPVFTIEWTDDTVQLAP